VCFSFVIFKKTKLTNERPNQLTKDTFDDQTDKQNTHLRIFCNFDILRDYRNIAAHFQGTKWLFA